MIGVWHHIIMEKAIESKLLDFNVDKSVVMVIGESKAKQQLMKELSESKIELCGQQINVVKTEKWLGDYLDSNGNNYSVITTIKKRYPLAMSSIMDIVNVIQDIRANVLGGLIIGIQMF